MLDLDIRAFFDSVPHDLLLKAVAHHTDERWVLLYIGRWLKAPMQMPDGTLAGAGEGNPAGVSDLARCWLTCSCITRSTDGWTGSSRTCPFERYADDVVAHCDTEGQAQRLLACDRRPARGRGSGAAPREDEDRVLQGREPPGNAEHTSFDFLGYTFRARLARGPRGFFVSFTPAMSTKARKAIGQKIRDWHLRRRSRTDLSGLAEEINPQVRGWIGYYGALLPLRAVLPRKAHRRAPRSMGDAQVQTTAGQARSGRGPG